MSQIDLIILIIVILGVIRGLFKGFVMSITSLAGLILGFYLSLRFAWYIEIYLREATGSNSPFMHILAFILCYTLVMIIVFIAGKSIEKALSVTPLGCVNRIGGGLFGAFKGLLLISAFIYVIEIADRNSVFIKPEAKQKSVMYKPLAKLVPSLVPQVKKGIEKLRNPESSKENGNHHS